jgi:hypothetical protein
VWQSLQTGLVSSSIGCFEAMLWVPAQAKSTKMSAMIRAVLKVILTLLFMISPLGGRINSSCYPSSW